MDVVGLLRRVARWLWTGRYADESVDVNWPDRSVEDKLRTMSDDEFARYLKAHSSSHGKV